MTNLVIFGSPINQVSKGMRNAAVFPLPVSATPMISRFCRPIGIACFWMGVGSCTKKNILKLCYVMTYMIQTNPISNLYKYKKIIGEKDIINSCLDVPKNYLKNCLNIKTNIKTMCWTCYNFSKSFLKDKVNNTIKETFTLYPTLSIISSNSLGRFASRQKRIGFGILPPLQLILKSSLKIRQSLSCMFSRGLSDQCRSSHLCLASLDATFDKRFLVIKDRRGWYQWAKFHLLVQQQQQKVYYIILVLGKTTEYRLRVM